ncbi:MAG: metal-dependent transcriptional regulator [Anaerolineales bacterium]|jgi:DtxR family Mn-dependent transcriptional regulator|nr:metal-dependent transcriptional regulator [Chloroflexota bacterium]MBK6644853.1 metal-dependent transcriptional regulator [Anaerolineales bacterium]MCC6986486.1 metal-dependent transcriptional regulator [Anaerolineales bacterium]
MSVSLAMQRYAAEIYRLQQDHEQVPLSLLTSQVDSSAQAISSMVKRLQKLGFLVHEPYRGVRLTADGERIAMPSLRRHRLTEVFLVKVMKYDWATAHDLSDTFEKGINDEIEDRMDELAGRPTRCPHGEPIPSKDGVMPLVKDMPLIEVPSGSDCVISRVRTHDMGKLNYIGELGLVPGTSFHLMSCAPFKGPLRLQMKPHDHLIGYELAESLWVEVSKMGPGNTPPLQRTTK